MALPEETEINPNTSDRERLYAEIDTQRTDSQEPTEPVVQEPEEAQSTSEETPPKETPPQETKTEEPPPRVYAGKFKSPDELEKSYQELQAQETKRNQEFSNLRQYIDWNKLRADLSGQQQPQVQQPQPVQEPQDNTRFFEEFAQKGPVVLDQRVQHYMRQIMPQIVQATSFATRARDAYDTFEEEFPDLVPDRETVWREVYDDLGKNPNKSILKSMREAAKNRQKYLNAIRDQGKQEAQVLHQEKKSEGVVPIGERASRDKTGTIKPPVAEEEKPMTLDDIIASRQRIRANTQKVTGFRK